MRFKTFLEAQVKPYDHEPQAMDAIISTLRKHCMDSMRAAQAGDYIYRGTLSRLKNGVYHPGTGQRKSQNTTNYYTKLLDSNPANKDFPKRSESFICSTRLGKAEGYSRSHGTDGSFMICFPFNETKVGVANQDDFWEVPLNFSRKFNRSLQLEDFNEFWEDLFDTLKKGEGYAPTLQELNKLLDTADSALVVDSLRRYGMLHNFSKGATNNEIISTFKAEIPTLYSYEKMQCEVMSPGEAAGVPHSEVWFSGKSVIIRADDLRHLREEFGL